MNLLKIKHIIWLAVLASVLAFSGVGNAGARNSMVQSGVEARDIGTTGSHNSEVLIQNDGGEQPPEKDASEEFFYTPTQVYSSASTPDFSGSIIDPHAEVITARQDYTVTLAAWRNIRPTESYLRSVSMLPDNYEVDCQSPDQKSKGWIVGTNGVILSYCNGVWDHAITVESVPTHLYDVQAISPTLAIAVGGEGTVLHYLYDKISLDWVWTKAPIPIGQETLYGVSMVPDGNGGFEGWAVGDKTSSGKGTLIHGTITPAGLVNGNRTYTYSWENVTQNYPSLPDVDFYYGLEMLSPNDGWIAGGREGETGVILHWNGTNWSLFQEVGTSRLLGMHFLSPNNGWVVGNNGVIYHYNGSTWTQVTSPTTEHLINVDFAPDGEGWIVGYNGILLKYSGNQWKVFNDLRTDYIDFWSIDFSSGHGWVAGSNVNKGVGGQILEYTENLWQAVTPPTDNRLNDVSIVNDTDAWAVGDPDSHGGTIIHWDGKHWQRWYQADLPIPSVRLMTIDMVSSDDGWLAGDPLYSNDPAIFLHWDGNRWAPPRYDAPVNVRVNDIQMVDHDFGWAVATDGNAVAKYDGQYGYWSANHTCGGLYYNLRGVSITDASNLFGWDAWAVGSGTVFEYFLNYSSGCSDGYAWTAYSSPTACPVYNPDGTITIPPDGPEKTDLYGVQVITGTWGFATGQYFDRATIYENSSGAYWNTDWCMPKDSGLNPSKLYSAEIIPESGVGWFGGYLTDQYVGYKEAMIIFKDAVGYHWAQYIFPTNGRNIFHRPIKSVEMSSDTMGWGVGDPENADDISVIYQYPFPNFTLAIDPMIKAIMPGRTANYTVTVSSIGGFDSDVNLTTSHVPANVNASVTPDVINAKVQSIVALQTSPTAALGTYTVDLNGSATFRSGDNDVTVDRDTAITLILTNNPVYSVSPDRGPAGTVVTIRGENFGSDPGAANRSSSSHHVVLAGQQLPAVNVLSWSNTVITVRVPDDPVLFPHGAQQGPVWVVSNSDTSNQNLEFRIENHLDDISFTETTGEYVITVTGTGLGNDPGLLQRSTYLEHVSLTGNWIPGGDVTIWNNNAITFSVAKPALSGSVTVTSNGYESNSMFFQVPGGTQVYLPFLKK